MIHNRKFQIAVLAIAWLIVNILLFQRTGVKVVNDSARYIEYANGLASGFYFDVHNFWYIGYSLYVLLTLTLFGGSVAAVVIGQYVLSFLAVLALYRAAFLLWNSGMSATITCLFFIGFVDVQMWNSYVLTESLYTSFICFSIYCLVSITRKSNSIAFIVLAGFVVLFTCLIKPTGIALLIAIAAVVLLKFQRGWVISIAAIVLVLLINRMLTTYMVIENYEAGEIIYAVSTFPDQDIVKSLIVERPADLFVPSSEYPPVVRVLLFVVHHPLYWAKLFLLKVWSLLSHVRPFWSVAHNIFSLAILLPAYFFFFVGMKRNVNIFAIAFLLIHILSVGITSDDWDGRFLIPMLPVIFVFSGRGVERLFIKT